MEINRVSANDVVEAYKATKLIPIRKAWCSNDDRGGCALEAIAQWSTCLTGDDWATAHLTERYIKGFLDAWDADEPKDVLDMEAHSDKQYLLGYWDAILCREAVVAEFDSIAEVETH